MKQIFYISLIIFNVVFSAEKQELINNNYEMDSHFMIKCYSIIRITKSYKSISIYKKMPVNLVLKNNKEICNQVYPFQKQFQQALFLYKLVNPQYSILQLEHEQKSILYLFHYQLIYLLIDSIQYHHF